MDTKLTDKQEKFCQEYPIDWNATQAAIRAGYSKNTANRIGPENLSKLVIQDRINELKKEILKRNKITVDELLEMFLEIAKSKKERSTDRLKAMENIGRHIGFNEADNKQKGTLQITGTIVK